MNKTAFIFPGQGIEFVGMGRSLITSNSIMMKTFEEASNVLGINLNKLILEGPIIELKSLINAFPIVVT